MATKDTQLDLFSVEINGEVYSLKTPPPRDSKVVLKVVEDLESDFDIQALQQKLELIAGCIRIVRYAVTGTEEVEKDVDQTLAKVAMGLQESMNDMDRIARTDLLSIFVDGVIFLFLGEESLAWDKFGKTHKGQELIGKRLASRNDSFENLQSLFWKTRASIKSIMKKAGDKEASETTICFAEGALRGPTQCVQTYKSFWEKMGHHFVALRDCYIVEKLKRRQEEDDKRKLMNCNVFKKVIVTYYARWVALKDMCTSLHAGLQSVQEKVWSSLAAARPRSVEEARKELPKMREEMEEMARKQREDSEERRRMMMEYNGDDVLFMSDYFTTATKGSKLDTASVTIDGVIYLLKEPPSRDSSIVLKTKKEFKRLFALKSIKYIPKIIAGYVCMARHAVTGTAELERDVDKLLVDVVTTLHDSKNDLDDVGRNTVLNWLVDGVIFSILNEHSIAWKRFEKSRHHREWIEKKVASRKLSLEQLRQPCQKVHGGRFQPSSASMNRNFQKMHLDMSKTFGGALCMSSALGCALLTASTTNDSINMTRAAVKEEIEAYIEFWEELKKIIVSFESGTVWDMLNRVRGEDEVTKARTMNSEEFKRETVIFYARWVALQGICSSLHDHLKSEEENLMSSLAARPRSVEEAKKLHEDIEKLRRIRDEEKQKARRDAAAEMGF